MAEAQWLPGAAPRGAVVQTEGTGLSEDERTAFAYGRNTTWAGTFLSRTPPSGSSAVATPSTSAPEPG